MQYLVASFFGSGVFGSIAEAVSICGGGNFASVVVAVGTCGGGSANSVSSNVLETIVDICVPLCWK